MQTDRHHGSSPQVRQTRWCVITGAPCSGKTTVIDALSQRGFAVVPEVARAYVQEKMAAAATLEEIKADMGAFEGAILKRKAAIEASLPADDLLFLDRALPDSIAYFIFAGLPCLEPEMASRAVRYARVFFLQRVGHRMDEQRRESHQAAARLEVLLALAYRKLGYDIIKVALMPVDQRVNLILKSLP